MDVVQRSQRRKGRQGTWRRGSVSTKFKARNSKGGGRRIRSYWKEEEVNIEHPTLNFEVGEEEVSGQWSAGKSRRKSDWLFVIGGRGGRDAHSP